MSKVDPNILEMPEDPIIGAMPYYPHLVTWVRAEVAGLTDAQLDFNDPHPDREWMVSMRWLRPQPIVRRYHISRDVAEQV